MPLPLQVLSGLLIENVGHVAAEDHVDLAAHGEVGGGAVGGNNDDHVLALGRHMQVHGGAHHLGHVHGALDAIGAEHQVVRAHAQGHVLLRHVVLGQALLLLVGQLHGAHKQNLKEKHMEFVRRMV